jgi:endonuclease-3 related protein
MFDRFGKQHWWPGDSRFEIILGAILTQNTNWTNVEKAITNVKDADALCPEKLYRMDTETLAQLIKPAGYFNLKAGRLKNFLQWLFENYDGQVDALENLSAWDIREQLLGIKGIGPETADSIALYAYDKPVFVVDTYTCRIMVRHGLIEPEAGYEQVREFMEASLPGEIELFNEYHALLVQVGKEFCRPKPKCDGCPLECLPHSFPS